MTEDVQEGVWEAWRRGRKVMVEKKREEVLMRKS